MAILSSIICDVLSSYSLFWSPNSPKPKDTQFTPFLSQQNQTVTLQATGWKYLNFLPEKWIIQLLINSLLTNYGSSTFVTDTNQKQLRQFYIFWLCMQSWLMLMDLKICLNQKESKWGLAAVWAAQAGLGGIYGFSKNEIKALVDCVCNMATFTELESLVPFPNQNTTT